MTEIFASLETIYLQQKVTEQMGNEIWQEFTGKRDRHVCISSPTLFNAFQGSYQLNSRVGVSINNLRYADDTVLIADKFGGSADTTRPCSGSVSQKRHKIKRLKFLE